MDITRLIASIGDRFEGVRPSPRALREYVVSAMGLEAGIGLAALIWAIWAYLFPRSTGQRVPTCQWRPVPAAHKCGAPLAHIQLTDQGNILVMICEHGHKVKKRVKP